MERSTIVRVREGLHARPATRFVKLAKGFESDIEIAKAGKSVSAKSSVKLMLLGVKELDEVTVRADGADAIEAIEALIGYLENPQAGLEEVATAAAPDAPAAPQAATMPQVAITPKLPAGQIKGVGASEGISLGAAFPFFPEEIKPSGRKLASDEIETEITRFRSAITTVQQRMDASLSGGNLADADRGIIAALKDIAADDSLIDEAIGLIRGGLDAVSAMLGAASTVAGQFAALDDPYLNARADDVHAVSRQICLALLGKEDVNLEGLPEGSVLIAEDIGAWDLARAPLKKIKGVVWLFRTELLFMKHIHLPSEDMQTETYSALLKAFAPNPVIVRTLDIGGDKPIAGIEFPEEENPFLGWRGIRMCLDRIDVFKPQLRALLRAAVSGNLKVMLPMVSDVEEIRATKRLIAECIGELESEGKAFAGFDLGVMIETPAAVFAARELAKEAAFFSIGTNDLTQYVMAADRLNPTVAKLNDVSHPAVMAAIEMTAKAGTEAGIMVGMCGEAAGRPELIGEFLRMGLTELSMSPASIPRAKKLILDMFQPSAPGQGR